jgi:glyoxylase-like metal-dependent hydrolase (beta-lactamase superfamily II)
MQRLAKDVYVESGFPGVTVGAIVTPDGIICVDTPTHPADARKWRLKLAQLSQKPIQFVINLDHHRDRVLGNQWFEAPVIAHDLTYERVRLLPEMFKGGFPEAGADMDLASDLAGVRVIPPQLTFADRMTLAKGAHEIRLFHRPGSAPGAIWVEIPAHQIVFVGDAVTHHVPPPMLSADIDAWLENLAAVQKKKYPARVIVSGRGSPVDKPGVKTMESFLRVVRRKVEGLVRANKSRLEAAALADDMLGYFTVPASLREHYTRRLRAGLEHVYDAVTNAQTRG